MARVDEARILNPGLLRHQITWQRKNVIGQNATGEDTYTWVDVLTCKAQVKSLFGRELESARQRWAEAQYQVRQHYSKGLDPAMRVAWYVDGEMHYLDVLDIGDRDGVGRVQVVIAKEWRE